MIRLRTFGGLSGTVGDAELDWLASHWLRAAVLVHVAVERTVPREKLQTMFWPEDDAETSSPRLNQIVYGLRQSLGADCLTTKGRNLVAGDRLSVDLLDFESAIAAGEHRRAMKLYSGPFLSGIPLTGSSDFESWVDARRSRSSRAFRKACRLEMEHANQAGDRTQAVDIARDWLAPDPLDDEAQHRLIEALARAGDRSEAIRQYEDYAKLLERHELTPLDETKQLVAQIRSGDQISPAPSFAERANPSNFVATAQSIPDSPIDIRSAAHSYRTPVRRNRMVPAVVLAALLILIVLVVRPRPSGFPRSALTLPDSLQLSVGNRQSEQRMITLSPDGKVLVYGAIASGVVQLFRHDVGTSFEAAAIPGTAGAAYPFISPDGQWVAFFTNRQLKKASLDPARPGVITIADVVEPTVGQWIGNETLFIAEDQGSTLRVYPASAGRPLKTFKTDDFVFGIDVLPGGKYALVQLAFPGTLAALSLDSGTLHWLDHRGGVPTRVKGDDPLFGGSPRYIGNGILLYTTRDGNVLLARRFNPRTLRVSGVAVKVLDHFRRGPAAAQYTIAAGTIAYAPGFNAATAGPLVWVDETQKQDTLPIPAGVFMWPDLTPDGRFLALPTLTADGEFELRVYDLSNPGRGVLDAWRGPGADRPAWGEPGKSIYVWHEPRSTGRSTKLELPFGSDGNKTPFGGVIIDVASDGVHAVGLTGPLAEVDLVTGEIGSQHVERHKLKRQQLFPRISPNDLWLAYVSSDRGEYETYVTTFPPSGEPRKIATGIKPLWSPRGDRLYFRNFLQNSAHYWYVEFDPTTGKAGPPKHFTSGNYLGLAGLDYAVSADGKRLLVVAGPRIEPGREIRFVADFDRQVKQEMRR